MGVVGINLGSLSLKTIKKPPNLRIMPLPPQLASAILKKTRTKIKTKKAKIIKTVVVNHQAKKMKNHKRSVVVAVGVEIAGHTDLPLTAMMLYHL